MKNTSQRGKRIATIVARAAAPFANRTLDEPGQKAIIAAISDALSENGIDPADFDFTFVRDGDGYALDVSEKGNPN